MKNTFSKNSLSETLQWDTFAEPHQDTISSKSTTEKLDWNAEYFKDYYGNTNLISIDTIPVLWRILLLSTTFCHAA